MTEKFLDAFLKTHGLTRGAQVHGFNHAVWCGIPSIVEDARYSLDVPDGSGGRFEMSFSNAETDVGAATEFVDPKTKQVRKARVRPRELLGAGSNATYSVPLRCTVNVRYGNVKKTIERATIAHLPIMVGSVLCSASEKDDARIPFAEREAQQGYFVVDGQPRVVITQKIKAYNRVTRTRTAVGQVSETPGEEEDAARVLGAQWSVAITSWDPAAHAEAFESESIFALEYNPKTGDVVVKHNSLPEKSAITVSVLLLALGHVWTEAEADALTREHHALGTTLGKWRESGLRTQAEAVDFIGNRLVNTQGHLPEARRAKAREFLGTKMLPHAKRSGALEFVRYMLRDLVRCVDAERLGAQAASRLADDPDFAGDEQYRGVAEMYVDAFRMGLWQLVRDAREIVLKARGNPTALSSLALEADKRLVNSTKITACVKWWLKVGLLRVQRRAAMAGTVDRLNLKSPLASISHMRVLISQTAARSTAARQLHESQTGFKCPYETPDGDRVGLTTHLALGCVVSLPPPKTTLARIWNLLHTKTRRGECKVFVNGDFDKDLRVDATDASRVLSQARERAEIPPETCFEFSSRLHAFAVRCNAGRLVQALVRGSYITKMRADPSHPKMWDWAFLEAQGAVEWCDANHLFDAEPRVVVAASVEEFQPAKHTHAHVHPSAVLGAAAATLPWLNMNQAPRNTYCTGMQKQAVARAMLNSGGYAHVEHTLMNPQAPLSTTAFQRLVELPKLGHGTNAVVAVNLDESNQEDAAVVCQDAVESGMFDVERWETYTIEVDDDRECIVSVVDVGDSVNGETADALLVKFERETARDSSVRVKFTGKGRVHQVSVQPQSSKRIPRARAFVIVLRRVHHLQVGDKMATPHGQKFTVGRIVPRVDMPFSLQTGMVPDIIVNGHCFPTRMTGASLNELGASKAAAVLGERADATPFLPKQQQQTGDWSSKLLGHGFSGDGAEAFANPHTGKLMPGVLNVGIMYVHVECHFSSKSFARSVGPVDALLRQPVHGRDRHGGLQFGVMEYACLEARGCAGAVQDRSVVAADSAVVGVCPTCRCFTWVNHVTRRPAACLWCSRSTVGAAPPRTVVTKHTLVLLTQELMAMGIRVGVDCS